MIYSTISVLFDLEALSPDGNEIHFDPENFPLPSTVEGSHMSDL